VVLVSDMMRSRGLVGEVGMISGEDARGKGGESEILVDMASLRASVGWDASWTSWANNDFGATRSASR
jgi:hypothetical protein